MLRRDVVSLIGIYRQKPLVKDIEIVCESKKLFFQTELFGNGERVVIPEFRNAVKSVSDHVIRGSIDGRYTQIQLKTGITLDMFLPQHDDFFRQYAIRTGCGDYSHYIIAQAWRKKGWVGTNQGLRRENDCSQDGSTWRCYKENVELPPKWQSEKEFFDWLGLKWVHPSERNV